MLGVVVSGEAHYERLRRTAQVLGCAAAPDDVYLGLRGLRTLAVRLERHQANALRSEEHTSELQSLMRISYAVFCLKKKKQIRTNHSQITDFIMYYHARS